jgi:general secretion pathway protein M
MSLRDRIDRLEPRERQLLGVLGAVLAVFLLLLVPLGIAALVGSKRSDVQALRDAINAIQDGRAKVMRQQQERDTVLARYGKPTPALAGFLAKHAETAGIEIPESQDRAAVPHGKRYEERSTKIVLRKVGMLHLVKFMERIEQSRLPVSISALNIRKRTTETDSYDVEMTVAAFDRKVAEKPAKSADDSASEGQAL